MIHPTYAPPDVSLSLPSPTPETNRPASTTDTSQPGTTTTQPTQTETPVHTSPAVDPVHTSQTATGELHQWVLDGINGTEDRTLKALLTLTKYDIELAERVYYMPFVEHHDSHDHAAIDSLAYIAQFDTDYARRVVDNLPELQPGITEQHADPIALAFADFLFNQPSQPTLPTHLQYDAYSVDLQHSGPITFTVAYAAHQQATASTAASQTRTALIWLDKFFAASPFNHHFVVQIDGPMPSLAVAVNVGTSISIRSSSLHRLNHEIVHIWFNNNEPWLDEGIAELLPKLMNHQTLPLSLPAPSTRCSPDARLSDFSSTTIGSVLPHCAYDLGELTLTEIYNAYGPEGFRNAFRRIADLQQKAWIPSRLGIDDITAAFENTTN